MILERFGGTERFAVATVPAPVPKRGEVLVTIKAAGVNPIDVKTRRGGGIADSLRRQRPMILGWDLSGVENGGGRRGVPHRRSGLRDGQFSRAGLRLCRVRCGTGGTPRPQTAERFARRGRGGCAVAADSLAGIGRDGRHRGGGPRADSRRSRRRRASCRADRKDVRLLRDLDGGWQGCRFRTESRCRRGDRL